MNFESLFDLDMRSIEEELDDLIPACWSNRPGDAEPHEIFTSVGHAMTRWERVEVALLETLRAMQPRLADSNKIVRAYSRRRETQQKLRLVTDEYQKHSAEQDHLVELECEYARSLRNYILCKTARNRIAHGAVVMAYPILMDEVDNGMIPTYQLHPSEGDQRSWMIPWKTVSTPNGEKLREGNADDLYINDGPIFSYMAKDIIAMSEKFLELDRTLQALTKSLIGPKSGFEGLYAVTDNRYLDMSL